MQVLDLEVLLGTFASHAEGEFSLMEPHAGTIFWTIIIFVLVLVILGKLTWKPILRMVEEREKKIKEALEKADRAQEDAEKALAEQKSLMEDQRKEAAQFLSKAKEDAKRSGDEILAKARQEANEQTDRARRQIEEEKQRAIEAVRRQAVDLAIAAASHLLGKTLDEEQHKTIVKNYIKDLPEKLERH